VNSRVIRALALKDMKAVSSNLQVWLPMLVLPLILGVILPGGVTWALVRFGEPAAGTAAADQVREFYRMLERVPPSALKSSLEALPSIRHQMVYLAANYLFAPFFLLIGLMAASVISADSFAGEKERGTLESLLFTPADLLSLFLGKMLAGLLPAVGLSLFTFVLYGGVVNALAWPLFGRLIFPHLNWLPLMLLVIPGISLLAILFNVFISARVATFQAAYQLGGLVVLPAVALIFGQVSGLLLLETTTLLLVGLLLLAVDTLLLRLLLRNLKRTRLFESQVR
jgi:ABC-2 type transport system permease protein